jgi:hypothetical protein
MGGAGVALAFVIPASAATNGSGTGATPEAATQAAAAVCAGEGLDPGSIIEQTTLPDGSWRTTMACVERTNPVFSGAIGTGQGATPEKAQNSARSACINEGLIPGNLIGMEEAGGGWTAKVECLIA